MTSGPPRNIAETIGKVLAFIACVFVCGASYVVVVPPLIRVARHFAGDHVLRLDVYGELAAALAASAMMLYTIDRRPWRDLGLGRSAATVRPMVTGWCIGGTANAATCLALLAVGLLQFIPSPAYGSWIGAALRVTVVLAPAALAEEVICRGYLLTVIRESVGARWAVLLTSTAFGLLHLGNAGATAESVVVVVAAGVLLATIRIVLNSLYAAWMAHLAWNWVMAVPFHARVSAVRFDSPRYAAESVGPAWLSGGDWGPEGGLVAALGIIGALGYLYVRRRREES